MQDELPKEFLNYIINEHADPHAVWEHMQTQFAYALYSRVSNLTENLPDLITARDFIEAFVEHDCYRSRRLWESTHIAAMTVAGLWTVYDLLSAIFAKQKNNNKGEAGFQLRVEVAGAIVSYSIENDSSAPLALVVDSADGEYFGVVYNDENQQVDFYDLETDPQEFCLATGVDLP